MSSVPQDFPYDNKALQAAKNTKLYEKLVVYVLRFTCMYEVLAIIIAEYAYEHVPIGGFPGRIPGRPECKYKCADKIVGSCMRCTNKFWRSMVVQCVQCKKNRPYIAFYKSDIQCGKMLCMMCKNVRETYLKRRRQEIIRVLNRSNDTKCSALLQEVEVIRCYYIYSTDEIFNQYAEILEANIKQLQTLHPP